MDKSISATDNRHLDDKDVLLSASSAKSGVARRTSEIVVWLIFIAHFIFIVRQKIIVRVRSGLEFDTLDTYAAVDVLVVSALVLILLCSGKTFQFLSKAFKSSVFWLLAYYLLCAMSAMWSSRPAYTLYRSVEFMVFFISLAVAVSYSSGFEKAERRVLLLSLLSVFVQMGIHMRGGIVLSLWTWHTNAYTASAAVIFAYCVGEYLALGKRKLSADRARRKMLFTYGCLSLPLLALGTSSASNVAALLGILFILFAQRKIKLMMLVIYAAILFFILGGGLDSLMEFVFPFKTEQEILTAGGRADVWRFYAAKIAESPIWGYGLGVLPTKEGSALAVLSHNFVFSILIGTGFLGFTIFLIFLLKLAAELIRSLRRKIEGATGIAGAMAAGLVNSLSMDMIGDRWATASFAFCSIFALFILHVYPLSFQPAKSSSSKWPSRT
jgi:O-antigen ligase